MLNRMSFFFFQLNEIECSGSLILLQPKTIKKIKGERGRDRLNELTKKGWALCCH